MRRWHLCNIFFCVFQRSKLHGDYLVEGEDVLLYAENRYFGPFKSKYRIFDRIFYIETEALNKNYVFPYYSENAVDVIEIEKQAFQEDPHYTKFARIRIDQKALLDTVPDNELLNKIAKDNISLDLAVSEPEEFLRICGNSPFLSNIPYEIVEQRINRLESIAKSTKEFQEERERVFDLLQQSFGNRVSDEIIKESDLYKELEKKYNEERRNSQNKEQSIQELKQANDAIKNELHEKENICVEDITAERASKYEEQIVELEKQLSNLRQKDKILTDIDELEKKQNELETLRKYLESKVSKLKEDVKGLQKEVSKAIDSGIYSTVNKAFDPYVSNAMLKAAAKWDSEMELEDYSKNVELLSEVQPSDLQGKELIQYVVDFVQTRRNYTRNEIINIYISVAQNFITIFSGEPGTGKTSMCKIISDTLGLNDFGENMNRFVPVSVERGWSSKRDFIGYFNPLTRKYDKNNSKIYDALKILDMERDKSQYPFFIMLDEANLSPIEFYWADFMRLPDRDNSQDAFINIGTEQEIYIPETLRFIATINTDQTTEELSPRLIDRACIIKLPKYKDSLDQKEYQPLKNLKNERITWKNFVGAFSPKNDLMPSTLKVLREIYELFEKEGGMNVSKRIRNMMEQYISAAQYIMDDESNVLAVEKAIDYAIIQKLLPKINGYYSNYEHFFVSLKQLCHNNHLFMTEESIQYMEETQQRNMGYCQYLI